MYRWKNKPTHNTGFTLVELLIVIAIIAILISILVPALGKAKEHAKLVICMSNLKDLGTAYTHYASETKRGFLPHNNNSGMHGGDGYGNYAIKEGEIDDDKGWLNHGLLFTSGLVDLPKVFYCLTEDPDFKRYNHDTYFSGGELRPLLVRSRILSDDGLSGGSLLRVRSSYIARNYNPRSARLGSDGLPQTSRGQRAAMRMLHGEDYALLADRWVRDHSCIHDEYFFNVLYADSHVSKISDVEKIIRQLGIHEPAGGFEGWSNGWLLMDWN